MSDLPSGWEWTTIGDVTLPVSKVDPRADPEAEFRYIDIGGVDGERGTIEETQRLTGNVAPSRARQRVHAGDTVLSTVRTYMRKTALVPEELDGAVASTGFSVLRPAKGLHPRYLYHAVRRQNFVDALSALQTGSSYPAVRDKDVRSMPLPFAPPSEQERIVEAIEEHLPRIDGGSLSLRTASAKIPRLWIELTRRVLHGVEFAGDIRGGVNAGHSLPAGWRWVPLQDLGECGRGRSTHRPRNDPILYGGPYPFIQTGDVSASAGLLSSYKQTYSEAGLAQSRLWPRGTVVITIAANIADSAVLTFDACFPDSIVGLTPKPGLVRSRWIERFIRVEKERLERFAPATAQKNINLQTLRSVLVPMPPLAEQDRLLTILEEADSAVDRLRDATSAGNLRSRQLKRAVLSSAFSGRLAPRSPDDEPASMLLDRIRAERNRAIPTRHTRKAQAS